MATLLRLVSLITVFFYSALSFADIIVPPKTDVKNAIVSGNYNPYIFGAIGAGIIIMLVVIWRMNTRKKP